MKRIHSSLIAIALSAALAGLGACAAPSEPEANTGRALADGLPESPLPSEPSSSELPTVTETPNSSPATDRPQSTDSITEPATDDLADAPIEAPTETLSITVYKVDNQCAKLLPEAVEVTTSQPIDAAVGEVIETQSNGDFKLSGYRVNVSRGVATVDLRLASNSRRKIVSLSSCEQFALFGSLRETLTKNPEWGVRSVRFTERGEAIAL